jgi:hypothetical protein
MAPDGTMSGDMIRNTPSAASYLGNNRSLTASTPYTFSIYAKATSTVNSTIILKFSNSVVQYNVLTNTAITGTWSSTSVGNGWYRLSYSFTTVASTTTFNVIYIGGYGTTTDQASVALWGAQLEISYWATSYIPTGSSQVTRAGDAGLATGNNLTSWYNYNQGTLYIESQMFAANNVRNSYFGTGIELYSGFQSDMFAINGGRDSQYYAGGELVVMTSGTSYGNGAGGNYGVSDPTAYYKFAATMKPGANNATYNGQTPWSDTSTYAPPQPTTFGIGTNAYAYDGFSGHIKKIAYYPIGLTTTNVQALTLS